MIDSFCCPNKRVLNENTCCPENTFADIPSNSCIKNCDKGYIWNGNACVDICEELEPAECMICEQGQGFVPAPEGTPCSNNKECDGNGTCKCPSHFTLSQHPNGTIYQYDTCTDTSGTYYKITGCQEGYHNISSSSDTYECVLNTSDNLCANTICDPCNECNSETGECEPNDTLTCDDGTCQNGECIQNSSDCPPGIGKNIHGECVFNDSDCSSGLLKNTDGTCTVCASGNVYMSYNSAPCATYHNFTGCKSNRDCGENQYCNLTGSTPAQGCPIITQGTCTDLGLISTAFIPGGLGDVIASQTPMSWWAAENWCKAQEKNLINIERFACYKDSTSSITENSGVLPVGCCAMYSSCSSDNEAWGSSSNYSTTLKNLHERLPQQRAFWTASNASNEDKCYAYFLDTKYGAVDSMGRRMVSTIYALCR